jgi:signal transduction histidine kinase
MATALPARIRQALGGQVADLALAVVLAVFSVLDVLFSEGWRGPVSANVLVMPAAALALTWRRTRPLASLAAVVACFSGLAIAFGSGESWSSVFIYVTAVYSAVVHGQSPLAAAALAAVGIAVVSVTSPTIDSLGEALWSPSLAILTIGVGVAGRAIRARTGALEQRAFELDREEQRRAAEAAAEERRRIARELHDIISHSLGVVVLQAGAAERVLDRDPVRAREVLESIRTTGQAAIGEMGTLLGLLDDTPRRSGADAPQPSLGDLESLVSRMRDAGLNVDFKIDGERRPLPAALELSAFRVVQEGLTNALKHAGPARVRAVVQYGRDELWIEVADDGAGGANGAGGRRGLAGIRERVTIFGGRLEAGPQPGGGWKLHATFPVDR